MGKIWQLLKMTANGWSDDYVSSMGAALSFYTLFSIAPMLLIVLSIAGFAFGVDAARGEISGQLNHLMGEQGAVAVQALIENVNKPHEGLIATIIGFVLLLVGATTVFGELQNSLDRIWCVPERKKINGIVALFRERILSFGVILGIGFILMVSLVFSAGLSAVGQWWSPDSTEWVSILKILNIVFSFVMTTAMFAMIYKLMPSARIHWSEVWIGALFTSILFMVGKLLIGLYIGRSQIASGFGVAGSLVVLLVWVYYSAQVFLLGAEFTWAYSKTYGSRKPKIEAKIEAKT